MIKILFTILLIIHAVIHLPGFLKAFEFASLPQLKLFISRQAGLIWLFAALLLGGAAVSFIAGYRYWWIIAAVGVIISQGLIFASWQDAAYGTIPNIILILAVVIGFSRWNFDRAYVHAVSENLRINSSVKNDLLTEQDIAHLPAPVQKYITFCGLLNREKVVNVKIAFSGKMRDRGKDWFPMQIEQYSFTRTLVRLFYMRGSMFGITVPGYHAFAMPHTKMIIKPLGLFTVVNEEGGALDTAETVTVLNDMCLLYPSSLIDQRLRWEHIDSLSTRVFFTYNNITVSAVLYFATDGRLVNFVSDDRMTRVNGIWQHFRFSTPVHGYKQINGINVLSAGDAVWHFPEGAFIYGRFILDSITYNVNR